MMDISGMVYARLSGDPAITSELATYYGQPAIVNTEFPSDQEEGWEGKTQYPRVSFRYDKQADKKRATAGSLRVAIYTLSNQMDASERLENAIRRRLKNVVMQPEDSPPFCVSWAQTTPFEIDRRSQLIILKEVSFDILEFPAQITVSPDPAMSMNMFLKELVPEAFLISYDRLEGIYEPTDDHPAVYVRLVSLGKIEETYGLVMARCQMDIHILAPTAEGRLVWARALYDELFKRGEISTEDRHPLKIEDISANSGTDYLVSGQVSAKCWFFMLSSRVRPEETHKLYHPYFDGKDIGG